VLIEKQTMPFFYFLRQPVYFSDTVTFISQIPSFLRAHSKVYLKT